MAKQIRNDEMEEMKEMVLSLDSLEELADEMSIDEMHEEKVLELQLTMATTSINHEYARIEFDDSIDYEKKEELLNYMSECRGKYLEARGMLATYNPLVLETFERDLVLQKLATITRYQA